MSNKSNNSQIGLVENGGGTKTPDAAHAPNGHWLASYWLHKQKRFKLTTVICKLSAGSIRGRHMHTGSLLSRLHRVLLMLSDSADWENSFSVDDLAALTGQTVSL